MYFNTDVSILIQMYTSFNTDVFSAALAIPWYLFLFCELKECRPLVVNPSECLLHFLYYQMQ